MSFSERNLNEGEELVLSLKPHWWTFAGPVALTTGFLLLLLVIVANTDIAALTWIGVLAVLGSLLWLAQKYADWTSTTFAITTRRLVYRSGILSKKGVEIPLDRVNNVIFNQRLFERLLGSGDLLIESAGESGQQHFYNVRKPYAVQNEIYRQMELLEERRAGGGRAADPAASVPEQIEHLAELRDRGLLTDEEFEEKKRDLLDRM